MAQIFTFTVTVADAPLVTSAYASISIAQDYFDTRLSTDAWDNASSIDQNKALIGATRAIDRLDYQGRPTDAAREAGNEFPRGQGGGTNPDDPWADDVTVPDDVVKACCEEALSLLDGNDPDKMLDDLRVTSEGYASARVSYEAASPPDHLKSGITSAMAWRYLWPFIRDRRVLSVRRV